MHSRDRSIVTSGLSADEVFVVRVAELLHTYGMPAPRVEGLLARLSHHLGLCVHVSASPTSLSFSFGELPDVRTVIRRVEPGDVDLGRLVAIAEVLRATLEGRTPIGRARRRLETLACSPPRYAPATLALAYAAASGASAVLLGGGLIEIATAAGLGLLLGSLSVVLGRGEARLLFEPSAAFVAGLVSAWSSRTLCPHNDGLVALASLIVLVPGLSLTVAMVELASRHWVSGMARLAGAGATFLTLAFGVALGRAVADSLAPQVVAPAGATQVPLPAAAAAVAIASVGLTVLFSARFRELGWILAAAWVALFGARFGASLVGPHLGAFIGALAVGLFSNAYATRSARPALVPLMPGILLLVPGSIGYRALDLLVADDVVGGLQTGFQTVLVATALVGGMLFSNAILPTRRPM